MKVFKKLIAFVLMMTLVAEAWSFAGNAGTVEAAGNEELYKQMKIEEVSIRAAEGVDKNAIELADGQLEITVDVKVAVPEGWAVTLVEAEWYAVADEYYYDSAYASYEIAQQPEDSVYSIDYMLHKYMNPDTYYLTGVYVELTNKENEKNWCGLSTYCEDDVLASEEKPVEFESFVYAEADEDFYEFDGMNYTGTADYTIATAGGKDYQAPVVTDVKVLSTGVLDDTKPVELSVTFEDDVSGVKYIELYAEADDGEESFVFETTELEKYVGTQTITMKSDETYLPYRGDGKFSLYYVYIEDFAGNYVEYYVEDDEAVLVGYGEILNEDGTYDEVTYKLDNILYKVCNGHRYVEKVTKATTSKNGSVSKKCKYCDAVKEGSKTTIYRIDKVKLAATSYVYNGKVRKPSVTVYDSKGNKIDNSNYTVTYPSGRKNVGQYKVKIVFKNNYKGTVYKTFTIKPKGTSITGTTAGDNKFTVKWTKQATQTSGYQVRYSTSSDFKSYKTKTVSGKDSTKTTVKNLKSNKKYYIKVRTYKTVKVNGESKKIYSGWSKWKSVKTK